MESHLSYCQACLSNQCTLYPLDELRDVLHEIKDISEELKNTDGGICWECKGIILKFTKFKKQIRQVQDILNNAGKCKDLQSFNTLSCTANHLYDYESDVSCDPLPTADSEIDIKQECIDNDQESYAEDIMSHEKFITDSTVDYHVIDGPETNSDHLIKNETIKQENGDVMLYLNNDYLQPEVDGETYSSEQLLDRIEEPLEPTNTLIDYNDNPNDYVHSHLKEQKNEPNKTVRKKIKKGEVRICFTLAGFSVKIMKRLLLVQNTWAGIKYWELISAEQIGDDSTFLIFDIPRKFVPKLIAKNCKLQYSLGYVQVMLYKNFLQSKNPPSLKK